MLEKKDLQAISELIDTRITKTEDKFIGLEERFTGLEERFTGLEERFTGLEERFIGLEKQTESLGERISDVETTLVNELVRTEDKLSRRIGRVENGLEELKRYFRIDKLDNGDDVLTLQLLKVGKTD